MQAAGTAAAWAFSIWKLQTTSHDLWMLKPYKSLVAPFFNDSGLIHPILPGMGSFFILL